MVFRSTKIVKIEKVDTSWPTGEIVSVLKTTFQFHPNINIQEEQVFILTPNQQPSKCPLTEDLDSTISVTDMIID